MTADRSSSRVRSRRDATRSGPNGEAGEPVRALAAGVDTDRRLAGSVRGFDPRAEFLTQSTFAIHL